MFAWDFTPKLTPYLDSPLVHVPPYTVVILEVFLHKYIVSHKVDGYYSGDILFCLSRQPLATHICQIVFKISIHIFEIYTVPPQDHHT